MANRVASKNKIVTQTMSIYTQLDRASGCAFTFENRGPTGGIDGETPAPN